MLKKISQLVVFAIISSNASAQVEVDPELPTYEPVSGISGNLSSIGSDTLNNLMTLWAEEFSPPTTITDQGAAPDEHPRRGRAGSAPRGDR